jgi:hypothetical protein
MEKKDATKPLCRASRKPLVRAENICVVTTKSGKSRDLPQICLEKWANPQGHVTGATNCLFYFQNCCSNVSISSLMLRAMGK